MNDDSSDFEPTRRQWVGYWSMIVQQTQNAFNDKMAQFILIPLAGALGYMLPLWGGAKMDVESLAGLMIALPFVLFAPMAGWLSDRFSKRDVMLGSALFQLVALLLICAAMWLRSLPMGLLGFFALAVQSAFFSPAKIGINKELVGSRHLGFATSIQQMAAMLAILVGQIIAGWVFDLRYDAMGNDPHGAWRAAAGPMLVLTICAVPALILAWIIPRVPAQGGTAFTPQMLFSHFRGLADLWREPALRRASFGVAFFWGYAAFINLWSVKLAREITGGGAGFGTLSSLFMAFASLGMAVGFGFSSYLLRKKIELGWVPLSGLAMAVFSLLLAATPPGDASQFLSLLETNPLVFARVSTQELWFLTILSLLAFSSAVFLAPLNAWMQDHYPPDKRGELQAAVNLQDCFAGIIAVGIIAVLGWVGQKMGLSTIGGYRMQMAVVSLSCFATAIFIIRILPADFIRMLCTGLVRLIYQIRSVHAERLPTKGGVLLLPNHVTYADAFFISAASPRPVRFVMDRVFTRNRAIRLFTGIFDTVSIRRDQPLDAIREVIRALKDGDVVCLFPEGQLTRTGTLCTLQRGFELIAAKAGHPLVPMWCDGSWGSFFSFVGNRFFHKPARHKDRSVFIAFGEILDPNGVNIELVRDGILQASADAIEQRFSARRWLTRIPREAHAAAAEFRRTEPAMRQRLWINGHQIGMTSALRRCDRFHVLKNDPVITSLLGIMVAFTELFDSRLVIEDDFHHSEEAVWIGGDVLRSVILATGGSGKHMVFHDFGDRAMEPLECDQIEHLPGFARDGLVVAMSLPTPPDGGTDMPSQLGNKPRTLGKLLPGWYIINDRNSGSAMAIGPAALNDGIALPSGVVLDVEGFLSC